MSENITTGIETMAASETAWRAGHDDASEACPARLRLRAALSLLVTAARAVHDEYHSYGTEVFFAPGTERSDSEKAYYPDLAAIYTELAAGSHDSVREALGHLDTLAKISEFVRANPTHDEYYTD